MRFAFALAVAACGSSSDAPPPSGSSIEPGPRTELRARTRHPGTTLVAGSRRIALHREGELLEVAGGRLVPVPGIGEQIAKLRAELGGDFEIFLGAQVIVVGGEEHHERIFRLANDGPLEITVDDFHLVAVAAVDAGEVWHVEKRLQARLATANGNGIVVDEPAKLTMPPEESLSPVSARKCATPQIVDLAASAKTVIALGVECNPAAQLHLHAYTGRDARTAWFEQSPAKLGFTPSQIAVRPDGLPSLVGVADGKLAIARVTGSIPKTTSTITITPLAATVIVEAVAADDGAIWTLSIAGNQPARLARDGSAVAIVDPEDRPLVPQALAFDARLGVVAFADGWLVTER